MSGLFRLIVAIGLVAMLVALTRSMSTNPTDARIQSDRPLSPQPSFCGPDSCRDCHSDIHDAWTRSGHSRTFVSMRDSQIRDALHEAEWHDAERDLTFTYQKTSSGASAFLPREFGDREFALDFALGSGQHAITFLSLLEGRDGESLGIEHRASWFAHCNGLAATPQPQLPSPESEAEHYGRKFIGEELRKCIACHTTRFSLSGAKLVNVIPQVSCESCHGPGQHHVTAASDGEFHRLEFPSAATSEIAVCERCHRAARDAPPDRLFPENTELVRFQPVGLTQSRCFTESKGQLKCSTCHDPHDHYAATPRSDYLQSCVACHDDSRADQVICPVEPQGDCITCHMPPVEVHPGVSFHDHWIRVRPESSAGEPFEQTK